MMPKVIWYFKLFNSIKEKHEVTFAELELSSLFGDVSPVCNFSDIIDTTAFRNFRADDVRVQDLMAYELPYGNCQGFFAYSDNIRGVSDLVARLAYTREFFVVAESTDPDRILQQMFPEGTVDKNVQFFAKNGYVLLRFITNQYFLEKSQYISKLSRNEREVKENVESLFSFLTQKLHRIPATETMQIGKRLEDYFAIREEPSLYLTHYMHPYKGKFHPKMVRALLNYAFPKNLGMVMDNFAGCGTLLVEATWMGLDNVGVEINPLSALMCNVKCSSLNLVPKKLNREIQSFLQLLESSLSNFDAQTSDCLQVSPSYDLEAVKKRRQNIPPRLSSVLGESGPLEHIIIAHELTRTVKNKEIRNFMLLALSGAISDLSRRRRGRFIDVLRERLKNLYLRICIFHELNRVLKIRLGNSRTYTADTRDMKMIENGNIDAILNSPPYSTALDYVKNDYPQLVLLELADIPELETDMIGSPRFKYYSNSLLEEIERKSDEFMGLPQDAKDAVLKLVGCGRSKDAVRTFKFFKDIRIALREMHRVLKSNSRCVILIGNNHYKVNGNYTVVNNDAILKEMSLAMGFKEDKTVIRELEKSQAGMIRTESVLILQKL